MLLNVSKIDTWKAIVDDQPGELSSKLEGLGESRGRSGVCAGAPVIDPAGAGLSVHHTFAWRHADVDRRQAGL